MADAGFAQRADLKLRAVHKCETGGSQAALPIPTVHPNDSVFVLRIVLYPDETGDCALPGMAHVVYVEGIAIGPTMQASKRVLIPAKQRTTGVPRVVLRR